MAEQVPGSSFEKLCLDVLQAVGKTLSQINLYSAKHPAVQAMLTDTGALMAQILAQVEKGELAYSVDGGNLITNGRIIGLTGQVPNSVPQIFSRFHLDSIVFKAGLTAEELAVLCRLASLRPDDAKSVVASDFLTQHGVVHITLNESVYTKGEEGEITALDENAAEILESIELQEFEKSLAMLVAKAIKDPEEQKRVMEAVMNRFKSEMETAVQQATVEIRGEKTVAANENTRTQAVVGNMANGVVTVNERGEVLMMNPEAESLFGSKMSEVVGKGLPEIVGEGQLLAMAKEVATPPRDAETDAEVGVAAKGDILGMMRASTVVVRNEAGKTVGMVAALPDKAKHDQLDKKEREFVAHVTHELRAPLSSIRAALEIIQDEASAQLAVEQQGIMNSALRNADRLEDLINGILDFSKIESGQMTVYPKPADAETIARSSVEGLRPWVEKKGIRLNLELQPNLLPVLADAKRCEQIIVNLLSNAIKFTPKGGVISVRVQDAGSRRPNQTLYCVQDTGPGIPKEEQGRVFEKFQQIASGEKHVGGTGLGLAIAKALVHMHKGEMWLESEPGQGAKFFFTLPQYEVKGETMQAAQKKAAAAQEKSWWQKLFGG
ncbi:MAG: ATP-binding protein [Elusimicrobiota bacterium]